MSLALPNSNFTSRSFNGTGWGTLRERGDPSQRLRRVEVPFVEKEECINIYEKLGLTNLKVRDGMICAGKYLTYISKWD